MKNKVLLNGTHVTMGVSLSPLAVRKLAPKYGTWYKSKERLDGTYPYAGPISLKNWYGNEVLTIIYIYSCIDYIE